MVCHITSRGFFDMLSLPSWSFAEMYKDDEMEEARKREAEKGQSVLDLTRQPADGNSKSSATDLR